MTPEPAVEPQPARPRRRSRANRCRRLLVALLALTAVVVWLHLRNEQISTPVGAEGVGAGTFPVAMIAGLGSDGAGFAMLTEQLEADGVTLLDFDADRAGTQPLVYEPSGAGQRIPDLAAEQVAPALRSALARAGLDPDDQTVDVVAHSTGGLLMRWLGEQGDWGDRVDDLVMVATPHHGSQVIYWETRLGDVAGLGADMRPGSPLLETLGYAEPPGQTYTAIGGDPWIFRWYRDGEHGFDNQLPTESAFLDGAALNTFDAFHGRLLRTREVVDLVSETLAATPDSVATSTR